MFFYKYKNKNIFINYSKDSFIEIDITLNTNKNLFDIEVEDIVNNLKEDINLAKKYIDNIIFI
jgi:hypothetical protein